MAHLLGYPTDIDRQPNREERSQEKQRGSVTWQLRQRSKPPYVSMAHILTYSNTQYNIHLIYFNSTEALSTLLTENTYDVIMEHVQGKGRIPKSR